MSSSFAQNISNLAGIWKISPVKILTLNNDQSFSYKKGAKLLEGTYEIQNDDNQSILVMQFKTETIEYVIEDVTKFNFKLTEIKSGRVLNAKLIESFAEDKVENYGDSPKENINRPESIDYEAYDSQTSIDDDYPSSIFTFFGGASFSSARHPNLNESNFTFAGVNNKTEYRSSISYQAGLNISMRIVDGLYVGTGIEASKIGFIEYIELSENTTSDAGQILAFSKSKYSVIGLHIPLYVNIMAYKGIRINGKVFASKFLNNTSKSFINVEGNNTGNETNEKFIFYEDEGSVNHPNIVSSLSYGFGLELQYYFTNTVGIGFTYSVYKNYLELDQRDIDNQTIGVNFKFSF